MIHLLKLLRGGYLIDTLQVGKYLEEGVQKKPGGFGNKGKVSTSTCQVCLQDPKLYNKVSKQSHPNIN